MSVTRTSHGFTLIELMIVIAIIAILAAIAIPAYQDYSIRSQVSEGLSLATGAKAAVWDFISNTGRLPPNNTSAGLAQPVSIQGNYVSQETVAGGVITITYGNKVNVAITGKTLSMSPIPSTGSIRWACRSATLAAKYLPTSCR